MYINICEYTHIYIYIYIYIHVYINTNTCVYAYSHIRMNILYVHKYIIHACMHIYILTYIHTYIHTCVHTYIQTYIQTNIHTNLQLRFHRTWCPLPKDGALGALRCVPWRIHAWLDVIIVACFINITIKRFMFDWACWMSKSQDEPPVLWARSGVSRDVFTCEMIYSRVTCLIHITIYKTIFDWACWMSMSHMSEPIVLWVRSAVCPVTYPYVTWRIHVRHVSFVSL